MIDPALDQLIPLGDIADRVGRTLRTVKNWAVAGYKGKQLEAIQIGDQWFTTPDCWRAFCGGQDKQVETMPVTQSLRAQAEQHGIKL